MPLWSMAALAVVAGLAIGRFATADGGDTPLDRGSAPQGAVAGSGSVDSLEDAVEARPDDPTAWRSLGSAYVAQAIQTSDPAFYSLAERAFDRATELAPDDPTILVGRGVLELSLHRFTEAEQLAKEATAALPGNADALGVLVDAQVELGRYDEAAESLQAMLDSRPGLPALARTSYQRELRGDLAGAEDAMREAVVAGSSDTFDLATVTALLGDLQRTRGDLDGAMGSYEDALRLSPDLVAAELGRAHVLAARGDLDGATQVVETVVERFPAPSALFVLADLQHATGDEQGEQDTIELVRVTSELQEEAGQVVDLELALFEADVADDPALAVELATAAHRARPDNVFAADALAWALHRAGDSAAALPHAEQAIRLGTADPSLRYHAAEVFAAVGDGTRAAEQLQAALAAGPSFSVRHEDAVAALARRLGVALPAAP
jgi:tetratricopeptide (TPR) repeat protein